MKLTCASCSRISDIVYAPAVPQKLVSCAKCSDRIVFIARAPDGSEKRVEFQKRSEPYRLRCEDCKHEVELLGSAGTEPTRLFCCLRCSDHMIFEARSIDGGERYIIMPRGGGRIVNYSKEQFEPLREALLAQVDKDA